MLDFILSAVVAFPLLARGLPQGVSSALPVPATTTSSAVDGPPAPSASAVAIPATGPYTGGDFTWYTPAEMGKTACGQMHKDTDPIAALPKAFFDNYPGATANPNNNPLCGRQISITAAAPGAQPVTVTATVADICGDCNITTSVDVTPVVFSKVADQSKGRLHNITWDWADATSTATWSLETSASVGAGPGMGGAPPETTSSFSRRRRA